MWCVKRLHFFVYAPPNYLPEPVPQLSVASWSYSLPSHSPPAAWNRCLQVVLGGFTQEHCSSGKFQYKPAWDSCISFIAHMCECRMPLMVFQPMHLHHNYYTVHGRATDNSITNQSKKRHWVPLLIGNLNARGLRDIEIVSDSKAWAAQQSEGLRQRSMQWLRTCLWLAVMLVIGSVQKIVPPINSAS